MRREEVIRQLQLENEYYGKPTMTKEKKKCNSVSAGFNLLAQESLGIVKLLLVLLARAVTYVLTVGRHMLMGRKLNWKQEREKQMNINDFAKKVTLKEGGKVSISIAQVKEVLKIVNDLLGGALYAIIRLMK